MNFKKFSIYVHKIILYYEVLANCDNFKSFHVLGAADKMKVVIVTRVFRNALLMNCEC